MPKKKKIKKKKTNWEQIKTDYCSNDISIEKLANKYGVCYSSVRYHYEKENWKNLKAEIGEEYKLKAAENFKNDIVTKKLKTNEFHTELYDKGLEVANKLLDIYLEELKAGKKRTRANAYNLSFIMKAIADAQKGQRTSLNINDNGELENIEPDIKIIDGIDVNKI